MKAVPPVPSLVSATPKTDVDRVEVAQAEADQEVIRLREEISERIKELERSRAPSGA